MMNPLGIAFLLYPVRELDRARAFYETTLGLTPLRSFGGGSDGLVRYAVGNHTLVLATVAPLGAGPTGGVVALDVDDFDAELARLRTLKPALVIDLVDTPAGRLAVFPDPDGNRVAIHQREPDLTGPAIVHQ